MRLVRAALIGAWAVAVAFWAVAIARWWQRYKIADAAINAIRENRERGVFASEADIDAMWNATMASGDAAPAVVLGMAAVLATTVLMKLALRRSMH